MRNHIFAPMVFAAALFSPAAAVAQPTDYYRPPLDIPVYLSANFGEIRVNRFHTGIDIKTGGVTGKPLHAAADGHIARVTVAPAGYGRALYVAHPNGTTTVYAHMDRFTPEIEEYLRAERYRQKRSDIDAFPDAGLFPVKQGDRIGFAGNSGSSSGPHLHFEVRQSSSSRTLNVMTRGWVTTAAEDTTPPRIVRLHHIDVDTMAGVPVHSRPRSHEVKLNVDGSYSLARALPLKAGPNSWFAIEATDRRDDVTNTFGIRSARLTVDGDERVVFDKDGLLFDENRYACASVLYPVQRNARWGHEAVALAMRGNNRLGMYKKATGRGAITFGRAAEPEAPKNIRIDVEDDAGNISTLTFAVEPDPAYVPQPRPAGRATSPYGIVHSADGLSVSIPGEALYEPMFYTQEAVTPAVAPRADSIRPLSPIYRTGDGTSPLHSAMRIGIAAADLPATLRPRAGLASISAAGNLSWAGGTWSNGSVNGTARDFGTFCVVADAVAPTVRASFADGADLSRTAGITLTATDNFSGIASYTGSIDGEWIIFERQASRGQYIHTFDTERLRAGGSHTLEFTVRDGAGNTATLRRTFRK
ncbi:MAG: M23 family metallopeptidase [Alistipes sp.]|jgi:hypothetical protein|nr:M23 family metallopeptidase [Alistipes sp.]